MLSSILILKHLDELGYLSLCEATILTVVGDFHTSTRDSTNSGCDPWWWLLACQGMKTSVWSSDTVDTIEILHRVVL